jgi:hypothetical protein
LCLEIITPRWLKIARGVLMRLNEVIGREVATTSGQRFLEKKREEQV